MATPTNLRQACAQGEADKVREILESSQDIPQETLSKALSAAAYGNHPSIVRDLLDHGAEITEFAVLGAAHTLSVPILQHLLDHGWDVNSVGLKSPALRLVVPSEECTRLLLENGADPNLPGRLGFTPLSTAIGHAPMVVMKLLVSYGAKLSTDRAGRMETDLLLDAINRKDDAAGATKFLLANGVDPNMETSRGPPLHLAIDLEMHDVVSSLLEYGADVSKVYNAQTAVQLAKETGNMDILSLVAAKTDTALHG